MLIEREGGKGGGYVLGSRRGDDYIERGSGVVILFVSLPIRFYYAPSYSFFSTRS